MMDRRNFLQSLALLLGGLGGLGVGLRANAAVFDPNNCYAMLHVSGGDPCGRPAVLLPRARLEQFRFLNGEEMPTGLTAYGGFCGSCGGRFAVTQNGIRACDTRVEHGRIVILQVLG